MFDGIMHVNWINHELRNEKKEISDMVTSFIFSLIRQTFLTEKFKTSREKVFYQIHVNVSIS